MTEPRNPWQTTGSEIKYRNPWVSLREDQVIQPDGKPAVFGILSLKPGVAVLPIDDDGNVYLVRQYRYAAKLVTVEVVSGGCREAESSEDAARRELREESGFGAAKLISLGHVNPLTSVVECVNHLYIARGLHPGQPNPDVTELLEILKIPYQQAFDWVMDSTITHGPSVATILKARDQLLSK